MQTWTRIGAYGAALAAAMMPVTNFEITRAAAESGMIVVLDSSIRRCDFSLVTTGPRVPQTGLGTGTAIVRHSGSTASAEVHLSDSPDPGTHFDVGLIQEPRPQAATCGPGDPGTAFGGLDLDGAGNGTVTVTETLRPGTTGVWVFVERGDPRPKARALIRAKVGDDGR
ncbi:hypothetical protein MRAB57_1755 [Mycobacterium rhizamassiliense]|uniref:Uncharacterized protein n=1 Tax=Mycobacterium rhizamassiliense TaxID=1841860 RepID=A0A2U3NQZ6_9MYCO|nr:hypothetical protein [Mycobacterium rhizamassiliense]SPM33948.1 hypothetical protein MRAB57_1755 [Mycobacterium rhizamassiliense]